MSKLAKTLYLLYPQPYDEKELLSQTAAGDQVAFAELVNRYKNAIYSQSLAYVKEIEWAEELTQDVFMRIWRYRHQLLTVHHFPNYLHILARNLIFQAYQKKIVSLRDLPENLAEIVSEQPDRKAEFRESYALLLKGIELLPEKRRKVFELSRLEGKTHEEIAHIVGINKITVAQYIMLSLNFLRTYLGQSGKGILVWYIFSHFL